MQKLTGSLRFNKSPRMPFHKMENISNFLDAAKNYGVQEIRQVFLLIIKLVDWRVNHYTTRASMYFYDIHLSVFLCDVVVSALIYKVMSLS
jgi:hypothetical protein